MKELEKFNFKYDEDMKYWYKHCIGTFNKFIVLTEKNIDSCIGQILFYNDSAFNTTLYLDTLYDLIQSGLVEKMWKENSMIGILLTIILTALTIFIVAVLGLGLFVTYKMIKNILKDF